MLERMSPFGTIPEIWPKFGSFIMMPFYAELFVRNWPGKRSVLKRYKMHALHDERPCAKPSLSGNRWWNGTSLFIGHPKRANLRRSLRQVRAFRVADEQRGTVPPPVAAQ